MAEAGFSPDVRFFGIFFEKSCLVEWPVFFPPVVVLFGPLLIYFKQSF